MYCTVNNLDNYFGISVEGWPKNKSRMATDYVNYEEQTATIEPNQNQAFSNPDLGKKREMYLLGDFTIFSNPL